MPGVDAVIHSKVADCLDRWHVVGWMIQWHTKAKAVPVFMAWLNPFNNAGLSRGGWRYPAKPWR